MYAVETSDPLEAAREALDALASESLAGLPDGVACDRVRELVGLLERTEAAVVGVLGEWEAQGSWAGDTHPAVSAYAWMTAHAPVTKARAGVLLKSARLAHRYQPTGAALRDGRVSTAHLELLGQVVTRVREPLYPSYEETFLDAAADGLSLSDFAKVCRHWGLIADDELGTDDPAELHDRREVHLSDDLSGMTRSEVTLDPEYGAKYRKVLELFDRPDIVGEQRTAAQRRADAFAAMLDSVLDGRDRANAVDLGILIDLDTYLGIQTDPAQTVSELIGSSMPVHPETVRRLACDGKLRRVLVDQAGEVLDVGRAERLATTTQRMAVHARDRHCTFPGCHRPGRQIHHLTWWEHGGPTDLANLCLLCRAHHLMVHNGKWRLWRGDDGEIQAEPTSSRPRVSGWIGGPPRPGARVRRRGRSRR